MTEDDWKRLQDENDKVWWSDDSMIVGTGIPEQVYPDDDDLEFWQLHDEDYPDYVEDTESAENFDNMVDFLVSVSDNVEDVAELSID